jgi:signal transduction histidine kinase
VFLLGVLPGFSQPYPLNGFSIQHFTDDNGLDQNSVNDYLFDNDGYLWLASQVGLIRFNGNTFSFFYPPDKARMEANGLFLGKDPQGRIYFQTTDRNLYRYPGTNGNKLELVNTPALERPILLNGRKQVFDFTLFLQGGPGGEVAAERRRIFRQLYADNRDFYVINPASIYFFYQDSLYYYDSHSLIKLSSHARSNMKSFTMDGRFYVLNQDTIKDVYLNGMPEKHAALLNGDLTGDLHTILKGHNFYFLSYSGSRPYLVVRRRLYTIVAGQDGTLTTRFVADLNFTSGLTGAEYNKDLDLVVVTTLVDGFYFLRKNHFRQPHYPEELQDRMGVYLFGPMAKYSDKKILTTNFIFQPDGRWTPAVDSTPRWRNALFVDSKKRIWNTDDSRVFLCDSLLKPLQFFPALDKHITDIGEDDSGRIYCLTFSTLWRLEKDSFRKVFNTGQTAGNGDALTLCLLGPHRFWIGTTNGLIEYDSQTGQSVAVPELRGAFVRRIQPCRDGSVLVGTYGEGYFYYHHGHVYRMPLDKNGFLITAHCFLEDSQGQIWIPCNKGLFKVMQADLDAWCDGKSDQVYYYYYGLQDGLRTNEFNGGFSQCGLIATDGFMTILSMKGLVCFYADSLGTHFPKGPMDLARVDIDGKSVRPSDTIELPPGYNNLQLEISSPFLGNQHNLYMEYSLGGLSPEWKEVPSDQTITLSRLAHGQYTLRLRKVNGFGANNYEYRQWTIHAMPYFYQTTMFRVLGAAAFALLLVLVIQQRWNLREKQKEIRVKAEKLKGTVDTLEETVKKLRESERALVRTNKLREKLISLVIHDLRSPLRFLTMLAADLHDNQSGFSAKEIAERTYWVKKGTLDIYNFSQDFLLWVTSQKDNFSVACRPFPIKQVMVEICQFFREQAMQKGNTISIEAPPDLELNSDPHILLTILRNLTDNANKYTDHGKIQLRAQKEGEDILIDVSDTGRGMSPKQKEAFLEPESLEDVQTGSQLGHKFILDLTRRIGGELSLKSLPGKGTMISICFRGTPVVSGD